LTDRLPSCVIIGYGNPLRGDDRAGFSVADRLRESGDLPAHVTAIAVHQLVPELAEVLAQAEQVIFVDAELAAASAAKPSPEAPPTDRALTVRFLTTPPAPPTSFDPHRSSPEGLLQLAAHLYDRVPSAAWLLGIPAVDFGFGDPLSPIAEAGIAQALDWITRQVIEPNRNPTRETPCMNSV
jgi:hydrogenase maturation protease